MILSAITTKVLTKLAQEAGSDDWWSSTEIDQYINDLYRETAIDAKICKKRDETSVTVAETQTYAIPTISGYERVISVLNVDYDNIPLVPTTPMELDAKWYQWREATSGIPEHYFFDYGSENTTVSLMRKPAAASKQVGFDLIMLPNELTASDTPKWPFADGFLLVDGTMSIALAKAGGGRDLDRSDWYWNKFVTNIRNIQRELYPRKQYQLRSIDEISLKVGLGNLSLLQLPVEE